MSERPKLPPDHVWTPEGTVRGPGVFYRYSSESDCAMRAWAAWLPRGITREQWEAMERDHRAMEALRSHRGSGVISEEAWSSGRPPASLSELLTGRWEAYLSQEIRPHYADDPADAILAALRGGVMSEHGFTVRQGGEEMRLQVKDCVLMSTQRYEAMERAVEFVREYAHDYDDCGMQDETRKADADAILAALEGQDDGE